MFWARLEAIMHVDPLSLVGAVLGSTLFVQFGRTHALKALKRVKSRLYPPR
jgi:hypothetical protein